MSDYVRRGDKHFRAKLEELFEQLQDHRVLIFSLAASLKADIPRYHYKLEKFGYGVPAQLTMEHRNLVHLTSYGIAACPESNDRKRGLTYGYLYLAQRRASFCDRDDAVELGLRSLQRAAPPLVST